MIYAFVKLFFFVNRAKVADFLSITQSLARIPL